MVELLVVVGIIAVLIAVLLPTLATVRESAKRAVCLSNLRQFSMTLRHYAMANHDFVPTGYHVGQKQLNYLIVQNFTYGSWRCYFTHLGVLYQSGLMQTPKPFFCPSENNEQFGFDGSSGPLINPWPPITVDIGRSANTRVGYGTRPTVNWPQPGGSGNLPTLFPSRMDRLRELRNLAIAADPVSGPSFLDTRHRNGVNVAYGDGSCRWVPRKAFDDDLRQLGVDFASNTGFSNLKLLDTSVTPHAGLWTKLDRY